MDDEGNATSLPSLEDIISSYQDCNVVTATSNLTDFNCDAIQQNNQFTIELRDVCGNLTTCMPNATVVDGLAPTIICPMGPFIFQLDTGQCDTIVNFEVLASDNCGTPVITMLHTSGYESGSSFPRGVHELTFVATDFSGLSDTCTFTVTVLGANGRADLACRGEINYSVNEYCELHLSADIFLAGDGYACADEYLVCVFLDSAKTIQIPNDTVLDRSFLGKRLIYVIKDPTTGNSCWGTLLLEDKLPPMLVGSSDTLTCGDDISPEIVGFPVPDSINIVYVKTGDRSYRIDSLDNCTIVDLNYIDSTVRRSCEGIFAEVTYRKYYAVDGFGRLGTAIDTFYFLRPSLAAIIPPHNFDNLDYPSLKCDGNWAKLANGNPDTSVTGVPIGAGCFNIRYYFEDTKIPICLDGSGSCYKINRRWTIFDWCTGEFRYIDQLIKIEDDKAPVITVDQGKSTVVDILGTDCVGQYEVPVPTITDNCADLHGKYLVWASGGNLTLNDGKYILGDLIEGVYTIYYQAEDCCGNVGIDSIKITVIDDNPPVAITKQFIVVSLTNNPDSIQDGVAKLYTTAFDNGSYDNCNEIYLEVRREDNAPICRNEGDLWDHDRNGATPMVPWNNNTTYNGRINGLDQNVSLHEHDRVLDTDKGQYVKFCCEDIGKEIKVWLRVWDDANMSGIFGDTINGLGDKYNENWSIVKVEDKTPPVLVPPTDMTVSCKYPWLEEDLGAYFGRVYTDKTTKDPIYGFEPICSDQDGFDKNDPFKRYETFIGWSGYATDACDMTLDEKYTIDRKCERVLITRYFTATDAQGLVTKATQTITIIPCVRFFVTDKDSTNANKNDGVIWPGDKVIKSCEANTDTSVTGVPIINPEFCEPVGIFHSDWVWGSKKDGCYKIQRVWRLMTLCGENTIWEYNQWIEVKNGDQPTILNCQDVEVCADDNLCTGSFQYTINAIDDCTDSLRINYSYKFDMFNDGSIQEERESRTFNKSSLPIGKHKITWVVKDLCGNVTECFQIITVKDCKKPVPYCYEELSTSINKDGYDTWLWSSDFDKGSFDNCGQPVELSFSKDNVNDDSLRINCDMMITYPESVIRIDLYVTDKAGNVDFCPVKLHILDSSNRCAENQGKAIVSGEVTTSTNLPVNKYDISISSEKMNKSYKTEDMKFAFDGLPMYDNYQVSPLKTDNARQGVNTLDLLHIQRHILKIKELENPFKLIAADANFDQKITVSDLVDIRKVVLEVTDKFPANNSWRFVRKGFTFSDPTNPWPFEEVVALDNLSKNEKVNYVGIKIGDVNDSYSDFGNESLAGRNQSIGMRQVIETTSDNKSILKLYLDEAVDVSGYQFALKVDPALNIKHVSSIFVKNEHVNIKDSEILVSWTTEKAKKFDVADAILTLEFDQATLSQEKAITGLSNKLEAQLYDESLDVRQLKLSNVKEVLKSSVDQVSPNPFIDQTSFNMFVAKNSEVKLKIFDATGQLILSKTSKYEAGEHQVIINGNSLPEGAYIYRVEIGDEETFSHRFIKIR